VENAPVLSAGPSEDKPAMLSSVLIEVKNRNLIFRSTVAMFKKDPLPPLPVTVLRQPELSSLKRFTF